MLGFIIGLVWFLVSVGNDKSIYQTTISVHDFLFWWYIATSLPVIFGLPLLQSDEIVEEISTRFLRGMTFTRGQSLGAAIISIILSRFLIFVGLSFLKQSVVIDEALKTNKFAVGAILILLGAIMGTSSMFPLMAQASLINKR